MLLEPVAEQLLDMAYRPPVSEWTASPRVLADERVIVVFDCECRSLIFDLGERPELADEKVGDC